MYDMLLGKIWLCDKTEEKVEEICDRHGRVDISQLKKTLRKRKKNTNTNVTSKTLTNCPMKKLSAPLLEALALALSALALSLPQHPYTQNPKLSGATRAAQE